MVQKDLKIGIPKKYLTYALNNNFLRSMKRLIDKLFKFNIGIKSTSKIDYLKSDFYVTTWESRGIFVNHRNYDERRSLLKNILEDLRYNEEPVFKKVLFKEQVYDGPCIPEAPDLILIPNGFLPSPSLNLKNAVFDRYEPGGYHDPYGIFIAEGRDIKKGFKVDDVKVIDMLPTLLHLYGIECDADVDGKVEKSIFTRTCVSES